jgi:DNA polymerase-3 subunit delta'
MTHSKAMQGFDGIAGQRLPLRILRHFISSGSIPHAMLFTGIEGIGKRTLARRFAMALHCKAPEAAAEGSTDGDIRPCGRCRACHQVAAGNHPDTIEIGPRKGMLRIDQVRNLLSVLTMKPFGMGRRVVILTDAQTMNPEAGNALLKVLEEPPADTIMVLTAPQGTDLLPTIASRCRHIRFSPLGFDELGDLLEREHGLAPEQARTLAQAADGSVTRALRLSEAGWHARRDWMLRASGLDQPRPSNARSATLSLAFAARLAQRKETIESDLELLKGWVRDLSIWPYIPEHVINGQCDELLARARPGLSESQLSALWEALEHTQKCIAANGNLRLTLDVMALQMADIFAA